MAGAAAFTGNGCGTFATAAQRATLLNPSQAVPEMSQRMVASRVMAPSPIPRERPFARGPGFGGKDDAVPAESDKRADGRSLSGFGTLSPAGPPVSSQAMRKRRSSSGGSIAAERRPMQESSSWQLLQGSGSQPRLSARSQKVQQWAPKAMTMCPECQV